METLKLLPAERENGPEILALFMHTFSDPVEPMFFVLFPREEEKSRAVERMWGGNDAKWVKIVDMETGKIVAASKWLIQEKDMSEQEVKEAHIPVDWHEDPDVNAWAGYLVNWINDRLLEESKGVACIVLDLISTHASYQKRGLGKQMMDYGTGIADAMDVPSFIDGTALAGRLYGGAGFKGTKLVVPVPEKWRERERIEYFCYARPRGGR